VNIENDTSLEASMVRNPKKYNIIAILSQIESKFKGKKLPVKVNLKEILGAL